MIYNTWELSGALVRMGEKAYKYAKLRNKSLTSGYDEMIDHFNDELQGLKDCIECLNGFSILWDFNRSGEITKLYITYKGEAIGAPWICETKGGTL